ncbi:putative short-chain dehydrogenase/reductase [Thozetella sp. PMI_491]|nr:putative short-chain dehydrogenase/reductase [Thozetella sp. PMI_491]
MSRYAAAHLEPNGAGDSRPTAYQIVQDAEMEGKLVGKVAVVTGSSSGIGVETVRALAKTGLRFFLPVRNRNKTITALGDSYDPEKMEFITMDQASLESVRDAAKEILAKTTQISILVNNAGILAVPELQLSKDNFELQFATNYLSHFLLFQLLKPALIAAITPGFQSRVVVFREGRHHPFVAYAQSKTATIYMANEIERRYGSRGVHATSVHPGVIATGLGRYLSEELVQGLLQNEHLTKYWKSPEQGAATTVWAAIGREWEGRGGKYLSNCAEAPLGPGEPQDDPAGAWHVEHTYNQENELRLWKDTLNLLNLADDE